MKKKTQILLTIFFVVFLLFLLVFRSCYSFLKEDIYAPNDKKIVLNVGNNEKVYIRSRSWGISSNHQEIIFSEKPISIADTLTDYIFDSYEVFYKFENSDKLIIYAPENQISKPKIPFSKINIVIKGVVLQIWRYQNKCL